MGRVRFITPGTVTIPISDGDTVELKAQLTAGEYRELLAGMYRDRASGSVFDPLLVGRAQVLAYLVGWSFVDAQGAAVPVSGDALDALDPGSFTEVLRVVETHHAAIEAATVARGK